MSVWWGKKVVGKFCSGLKLLDLHLRDTKLGVEGLGMQPASR